MLEQDEEMASSHSLSDQEEMEEIERQLLDEQVEEKRQAGILASQYHTLPQAELVNRLYAVSVLFISKHGFPKYLVITVRPRSSPATDGYHEQSN